MARQSEGSPLLARLQGYLRGHTWMDRSGGWDAAIALAEKLRAAVYGAPLLDRASFPEDHPLFRGPLGMSVKTGLAVICSSSVPAGR
jgi:hypothetical protein